MRQRAGTVLIADGDEKALRHAAAVIRRAGYEALEVTTGADAIEAVRTQDVALVLLEIRLPDMTGYEVCHEIRSEDDRDLPIFFLTSVRTEAIDRVAGMIIGADHFLAKPFEPDELVVRVRRFVTRSARSKARRVASPEAPELTPREREVLDLLAQGLVPKEIATELSIAQKTVATHVQHLFEKVGVHSRSQLIARAYVMGLVVVPGIIPVT
jgi:NarL family two-component system response regulator LiaR